MINFMIAIYNWLCRWFLFHCDDPLDVIFKWSRVVYNIVSGAVTWQLIKSRASWRLRVLFAAHPHNIAWLWLRQEQIPGWHQLQDTCFHGRFHLWYFDDILEDWQKSFSSFLTVTVVLWTILHLGLKCFSNTQWSVSQDGIGTVFWEDRRLVRHDR